MATLVLTVAAGGEAGAVLRRLATVIDQAASVLPGDRNSSGASVTCTIDNAPSSGFATIAIAGAGLAATQTFTV